MTRIGITGHQRLEDSDTWVWVGRTIRDQLDKLAPPLVCVTSLAIGADQLVARLVLEKGGTIHAILPFADIERSFSAQNILDYRHLIKEATVEVLETPGSHEDAYLAAGRRVVDLSDFLLAVWDGLPAKGKGGTADTVAYAVRQGVRLVHINPVARTVTTR